MNNLQRYENNGLELVINTTTGESFASQGMIAKMCNKDSTSIRYFLEKEGVEKLCKVLPVIDSRGVEQSSKLYPEEVIKKCIAKFNIELFLQCADLGLRNFLHKLAGYEVISTAVTNYTLPQTYLEALEALVATEKEKQLLQSENKQLTEKIVEDAPKVEFAEQVYTSDDCISIGDFAKVINIPGLGRTRLFKKLRDLGILRVNNTPFQKFIERGYFEVTEYVTPIGINLTTKITGRGQVWLTKKLTN